MLGRAGTDAGLVVRAKGGDLDAFDRLVVRHRARLLDLARQLVSDREAAQDLVQEGLVRAFRALPALREDDRFGPWANTILRRLCQQWLRDGRRRPQPRDGGTLLAFSGVMWDRRSDSAEEVAARVRAALAVLSSRERQVMILHYLEGLSCEEIAQRLHLTNPSVRRILHYSRRKARTEVERMKQAATAKRGPRQLTVWINGGWSGEQGRLNLWDYTKWDLAQSILLAANKTSKTAAQLAAQVEAHEGYVRQIAEGLVEMDLLRCPRSGHFLTTFLAFDAEDWRRLIAKMHEPAGAAAQRLAEARPSLQEAYARAPLAHSGWAWEQVAWPLYATVICNIGASRHLPPTSRRPYPQRPDGGAYWVAGHELVDDLPMTWMNGLHNDHLPGIAYGWCMHRDIHREKYTYFGRTDRASVVSALAAGPQPEARLLAALGDEPERWRGALAELTEQRLVARADGTYRLAFPIFRRGDSAALSPVVEPLLTTVADGLAIAAFSDLDAHLDEMGYRELRDQYPEWHGWLAAFTLGEAVHFLLEQGFLPRPPDPAPPNFALLAWEHDLPLMSWE